MKRLFSKMALTLVLVAALTFLIGGTASAQSVTANHQTALTTMVHAVSPQNCVWVQKSNWETPSGVNIIRWEYTCGGGEHCQAIDDSYYGGGFLLILTAYYSDGTEAQQVSNSRDPFSPGQSFNTDTISGGYHSYVCSVARF